MHQHLCFWCRTNARACHDHTTSKETPRTRRTTAAIESTVYCIDRCLDYCELLSWRQLSYKYSVLPTRHKILVPRRLRTFPNPFELSSWADEEWSGSTPGSTVKSKRSPARLKAAVDSAAPVTHAKSNTAHVPRQSFGVNGQDVS